MAASKAVSTDLGQLKGRRGREGASSKSQLKCGLCQLSGISSRATSVPVSLGP